MSLLLELESEQAEIPKILAGNLILVGNVSETHEKPTEKLLENLEILAGKLSEIPKIPITETLPNLESRINWKNIGKILQENLSIF